MAISGKDIRICKKEYLPLCQEWKDLDDRVMKIPDDVTEAARACKINECRKQFVNIPVEEVNREKLGIRVGLLKDAGYQTMDQLIGVPVDKLVSIKGIGDQMGTLIVRETNEMLEETMKRMPLRLRMDQRDEYSSRLVSRIYRELYGEPVKKAFAEIRNRIQGDWHPEDLSPEVSLWERVFRYRQLKKKEEEAYLGIVQDAQVLKKNFSELKKKYNDLVLKSSKESWDDFSKQSAAYYSLLDALGINDVSDELAKSGLSAQLIADISSISLELSELKCTLRHYQTFGVQYILKNETVLLGDEMGLGKTVQAIATMVHLAHEKKTHFFVVCPASVLVNWCRELEKHSSLHVTKIYGNYRQDQYERWCETGGVAVTTYETIGKLKPDYNRKIDFLCVDEAHYIKNPNANRTHNVLQLRQISERVLFMTGTPLENNVEEMIFLLRVLNPDVANAVESMKQLSRADQFRKEIETVYFRRTREDVLQELPQLEEKEEWTSLNMAEYAQYLQDVNERNFMAMRQVSWRVNNPENSGKLHRLEELVYEAFLEHRKVLVFSYFLHTIEMVCKRLGEVVYGPITGSVSSEKRQEILDDFGNAGDGAVLVCQIQTGGTGLNIQAASMIILCEPQIKPSLEHQAIARAYRMGQVRNVLVHRLLCERTIDERILDLLGAKQMVFDEFADESVSGQQSLASTQMESMMDAEQQRLLTYTPEEE
ncbi:MAG: DEAD/DEAH box helicase [Erysipelotrichaceae bacterium]|nr:DEAD/DEAH box helicase [Erysipelotrichaceae bacterium]